MKKSKSLETFFGLVVFLLAFAAPSWAQDPYEMTDNTWISLTGTVETVMADQFVLKFHENGDGWITVEMDDGDRDADAYKLVQGDTVTVFGLIDNDLFETRTIEAGSVYVANLDTYFYASAVDEEDTFVTYPIVMGVGTTVAQGTVTQVRDEEFTLDTGTREITVEVEEMPYNPLDDEGYQKINPGDKVSVTGEVDYDFLEGREIVASSIVTLRGS